MILWFQQNMATIIIGMLLAVAVIGVIAKLVRDKRSGRSSCGCGCDNCAMRNDCHDK